MNITSISSTPYSLPGETQSRFFKWCIYFLGFVFLINCFTPLRLHYDMLRYFAIKDCIESKCPPGADPADYMPYGYTALLLLLSKLGVLKSFTIVFVNCLFLSGALLFIRKIFIQIRSPYFLFFLVLLNWTVIKFVAHPLSELQYLFFSMAGLYSYYLFVRNKKTGWLLLAFLMAGFAFLTRTVGITVVAAISVALIWEYRKQLILLIKKNRALLLIFLLCMIAILFFSKQLGLNHYTGVMSSQFKDGLHFSDVVFWHFSEWGEIILNTSRLKVVGFFPAPAGEWIFIITGVMGLGGFIYLCFIQKSEIPFVIKAYLFFYILLMFNWPFADPRFWVPVIPLIAAVFSQTTFSKNRFVKWCSIIYFVVYSLLGLVSLVYMTRTSLNKKELSKTQAKGVYRNEYELHFFGKTLSDTVTRVDSNLVEFLNRYDK